jgi:UDP-N-acetylmuramate dehydrogenase
MLHVQEHAPLQHLNTFGMAVTARYLVTLRDPGAAAALGRGLPAADCPPLVMGGGSNVLFTRDFPGVVILNRLEGIRLVAADDRHVRVQAGAGEDWDGFVRHCLDQGWYGLENLALIPGTVGAAPVQNIGAYGVELKDVFEELEGWDLPTGRRLRLTAADCRFGYRDSVFKGPLQDRFLITAVTLRLSLQPRPVTDYRDLLEELRDIPPMERSPRVVCEAVGRLRRRKLPDPRLLGNAGSFFKNPVVSRALFADLQARCGPLPAYDVGPAGVKLAAAALIERTGWKGRRRGRCGVHDRQPLVLVNLGGACGREIVELAEAVREAVHGAFGVWLEPEPRIL